jgi:NADPH2:quinone reductase
VRTEFRAIVQSEYGAPEKVLRIVKRQFKSEELGTDVVLVRVIARPVHPGDIQILSGLPQGGQVEPIPDGVLRVPGLEGVGIILQLGANPDVAKRFSEGQRVAFFPAMGSWAEYVVVRYNSLLPVPDEISDQTAAQMLINTITASVLLKAGGNSLEAPTSLPAYILQNAAASSVGRLLTQVALDRGVHPIGASVDSSFLYSKVKGELERDVREIGFTSLTILRPGIIEGKRMRFVSPRASC